MKRPATVCISEFSLEVLAGEEGRGSEHVSARLARAIRLYLNYSDSDQPGWLYPSFRRDKVVGEVEVELSVGEGLLRELEIEAERQGVTVSQMTEHAALYYAAELDAGHLTQRIRGDLDAEAVEGAGSGGSSA